MNLSKSRFTKGVQCPKMLWMDEHKRELFDESVMNEAVLKTGNEVGDLAMGYFGDYVEIGFDRENMKASIKETQQQLAAGAPVICEATFSFDGNLCMVDILRVAADDSVDIFEVKSSTRIDDIYYHDAAYQCWVLTNCGLNVKSVNLMHLNNKYVRQGELDLQELFVVHDITDDVAVMQSGVAARIPLLKQLASQLEEPEQAIGLRCFSPYECGYRGYCWRDMPSPNVFDIGRTGPRKASDLMDSGIITFEDVLNNPAQFNDKQLKQVITTLRDLPPYVDVEAIRDFRDTLSYPLYFLDFETFNPAIPPFDGIWPYQQIPSQYSLHFIESKGAPLQHREFLGEEGTDPRRQLAERLCADIPPNVCTLAYYMSFEKTVIAELARAFPDLSARLMNIRDNIRDLAVPFQNGDYYSKELKGSYSIKYVLPALFPDDPELSYKALEGIHNGSEAMAAFADLPRRTPEERAVIRNQLLAYCKLDTLAMVRIWEKLRELARG